MAKRFQYRFEWDRTKARSNIRTHSIPFERAASIFLDPDALSEFDGQHSDQEERWITLGMDSAGVVLSPATRFKRQAMKARPLG